MKEEIIEKIEGKEEIEDKEEYLEAMDATDFVRGRIEYFLKEYKKITDEKVKKIFISEVKNGEENHRFGNLWFFSDTYAMEMKNFLNKSREKMDMNKYSKKVIYSEINKNHPINEVSESSILYVFFRLQTDIGGELRASGKNCEYLWKIIKEVIVSNYADDF